MAAIVQDLVRNIVERCNKEDAKRIVPDAAAEFVARTRADPCKKGVFLLDKTEKLLTEEDIDNVRTSSTQFLLDEANVALSTMTMQDQEENYDKLR